MKYIKLFFIIAVLGGVVGLSSLVGYYFYVKPDLPSVSVLKEVRLQTPMRIYTKDGKLISQYGVKRRIPVKLEDVPQQLINAIIATEDSRFYEHFGLDPIGAMRAAKVVLTTGERSQGASTLTMQLARGFFLSREKRITRKIKEIFIAFHMEQELSKDEILELYLNKVELGHRAFGVGAAAQVYYGKSLNELTLAQIATIAGLPQAPSVLNPISRPERSKARRRIVLLRMLDEQYITREEYEEAVSAPVTAKRHGAEIELDAPYLADIIYSQMVEMYGKEEAESGGYQVFASATASRQSAAQTAVKQNLHDYDERHGYRGPITRLWPIEDNPQISESNLTVDAALDSDANLDVDASEEDGTQALDAELKPEQPQTFYPSTWDEIRVVEALRNIPAYSPLVPAAVIGVSEDSFISLDYNGIKRTIDWQGMDWARPYINDKRQGPIPQNASDIVSLGDVIYIRQWQDSWQLAQLPNVSGALVSLNSLDGAVEAIVGGYSFYQSQFNRATQAERQVGSNVKPFVYSAAIEQGYTLASVINDAPINEWDAATGIAWRPQNSPAEYDGPIRMRVALGKSKNVVSIRLLRGVGMDKVIEHLTKFGFDKNDIHRDETLSLGSSSHTPMEVARAMSVIANGGFLIEPYFIDRVQNDQGQLLWKSQPLIACDTPCKVKSHEQAMEHTDVEAQLAAHLNDGLNQIENDSQNLLPAPRVISAQNAFLVAEMMRTAVRTNGSYKHKTYWMGTGWRVRNLLGRADLHGKTGTTNDSRDTWFSGFGRDLVTTTWVGFDDMNRQLGRTSRNDNLIARNPEKYNWIGNAMVGGEDGARAAGPAWIRYMEKALVNSKENPMTVPEEIVRVRIDRSTGKLTRRTDHTTLFEYFLKGTEPTSYVLDEEIVDPSDDTSENVEPEEIF